MHEAEEPLLLQLVLLLVIVEHVVIGGVQLELDVVFVVTGVVLLVEELVVTPPVGVEVVGGVTQIVSAHVVVVSGELEHTRELPPLMALQLVMLPVVAAEHVVIGDVQLVIEADVVVLVYGALVTGAVAFTVTGKVLVELVKGISGGLVVEVREIVVLEVIVVEPSLQEPHGITTVVI